MVLATQFIDRPPFGERDDTTFLQEMVELTRRHLAGCAEYARIWPAWSGADSVEELPFVHVGLFKHVALRTQLDGIRHQRTLTSSATTSGMPSKIALDEYSSALQAQSSLAILKELVGAEMRPLLVLDSVRSLRRRDEVSARIAAAMSLRPLATEIQFLFDDDLDPARVRWDRVVAVAQAHDALLVYGFTWVLWLAWASAALPAEVRSALRGKRIAFVHSGGWKKLESLSVDRTQFNAALLQDLHPSSCVVDYYGLVEQIGVIYPLCDHGFRHVPCWADVIVRDPYTLAPLNGDVGLLQLLNTLAHGAPYHSVLTEDMGRVVSGTCPCGRAGKRFELLGRVPKAEIRGCANV